MERQRQLHDSTDRARRHRRREPRHPAGVLPRHPQPRHGGAAGARSRDRSTNRVFRQRAHHRRPHPPPVGCRTHSRRSTAASRSTRSGIRLEDVTGARGRRRRRVRRADRPRTGSCRGDLEPDRDRRADAPPLSRRASRRSSTPTSALRGDVAAPVLGGYGHRPRRASGRGASRPTRTSSTWPAARHVLPSGPAGGVGRSRSASTSRSTATTRCGSRTTSRDIVASADLKLQGTYDRPAHLRPRRDRPRRHPVRGQPLPRDARHDRLPNPPRQFEPFFDIEAETRVRAASQSDRQKPTASRSGVTRHADAAFHLSLNSDPPLPRSTSSSPVRSADRRLQRGVARAQRERRRRQSEEALLQGAGARLLAGSISAPVRRVVEQTLGSTPRRSRRASAATTDPLTPSARLILGKRLSPAPI